MMRMENYNINDICNVNTINMVLGCCFTWQERNQRLIWNLQTPEARMSHDTIRATGVILSEWKIH
jgi:hypothetical protein